MERKKTWIFSCDRMTFHFLTHQYFKSLMVCFLFLSASAENCPLSCTCIRSTATVTCLDSPEIELPLVVSQWTHTLILRGNNVTTIPEGAFSKNGTELGLLTLLLTGNNVQVIEAYAFAGLPHLLHLDLSYNNLMVISAMAFGGLRELRYLYLNNTLAISGARQLSSALSSESLQSLQRLELSGNGLKAIPISRFDIFNLNALVLTNNSIEAIGKNNVSSLSEFKKIRLYLSQNPFKCSCELEPFYYWLKNGSQCPDSSRVLCAQPEARRGTPVEKLRREDVDCINPELEAVSYVFLGIVLALIGVVFLMVLYLNRGGIKRWLNNIREACRDQMEVYHYRYEQDSDPRLANVAV